MDSEQRVCSKCGISLHIKCFRAKSSQCVWCQYEDVQKRAINRYRDKNKVKRIGKHAFNIDQKSFLKWYDSQGDKCHYCGVTFNELRQLKLYGRAGYYVSWDIDRLNPDKPYEIENIVLSCMICNTAKSNYLTVSETKELGKVIKSIYEKRINEAANKR